MLLKEAKTTSDLLKWGCEYMAKFGFAPYQVEIQAQWMCFNGMRVHEFTEEEKQEKIQHEEEQARLDKEKGLTLIATEKVNENVPLEWTNFKVDITKYIPTFKPKGFVPDKLSENLLQTEEERIEQLEKKLPTLSKNGKMRGEDEEEQVKVVEEPTLQEIDAIDTIPVKKKRGRPRKNI